MSWLWAAHGLLLCLESLDRLAEGERLGEQLLARAEAAQLTALRGLILRPLALIQEQALNAISQSAKAAGGYLFGVTERGLALLASSGGDAPPPELVDAAARCIRTEAEGNAAQHTESAAT